MCVLASLLHCISRDETVIQGNREMNDKNSDTATFKKNLRQSNRKAKPVLTEEQFAWWLEKSLEELEERNSDFATPKSNLQYFSR